MRKILMSAAMAAMLFTGCGGVDKERLAQLTGDKSFDQVQAAYKSSIFNEKEDDAKIYEHYLKENEEKVVGFDFEMYSSKTAQDYQKVKTELSDKLQKMRDNLDKITIPQLRNEMQGMAFFVGQAKPIDDYVKALERLQKDKWAMLEADKKAQKEKWERGREEARARGEEGTAVKDTFGQR